MAVNDIVQIRFFCQDDEQGSVNVRHYKISAQTGLGATLLDIASHFSGVFGPLYKPLVNNNSSYRGTGARIIFPLPATGEVLDNTAAGVGTGGANALPRQTCGLLTLRTIFAGPKNRGRLYIPFPSTAFNDANGLPTAGYLVAADALGTALGQNQLCGVIPDTSTLIPVLFNRVTHASQVYSSIISRPRWATQRRRGSFGRPNLSPI